MLKLAFLVSQVVAEAMEGQPERLARVETQMLFLTATINRIEQKVDRLPMTDSSGGGAHLFSEHGLEALLALLIALDKGGYYIRRRNDRIAKEKADATELEEAGA